MSERLRELLEAVERALTRCAEAPLHPAIVRIFAVRREGRHLVVEREKLDGVSLSGVLRQRRSLPFDEAIGCLRPLAAAIDYAAEHDLPSLDTGVDSVIAPVGQATLAKASPLALTILNQLKDQRQQGKTMLFDPLRIDPDLLETQSVERGIASVAALAFELLSGRPAPTGRTDYRTLAHLSEAGNLCLCRGLKHGSSFSSASVFIEELARGCRSAVNKEPAKTNETPL